MSDHFSLSTFLSKFYDPIFPGTLKVWSRQTKKTSSYRPGTVSTLVSDVDRRKQAEDLYLGLSTQPGDLSPTSRGSNDTAVMLPGFFADVDFANAKESIKPYPPDAETALALIHSFDQQPFLVQNSGSGLHVLYKLDRPIVMDNREARRKAQAVLRNLARKLATHFELAGYEIDNVFDLARVYRVPGSYNCPSSGNLRQMAALIVRRQHQ